MGEGVAVSYLLPTDGVKYLPLTDPSEDEEGGGTGVLKLLVVVRKRRRNADIVCASTRS
jgi:hypothetical protein